jgi:hypothetical protein
MPAGAWEQGFLSALLSFIRATLIFSHWTLLGDNVQRANPSLAALAHDIKKIGDEKNYRRLAFTREAAAALENWHINPPRSPRPSPPHQLFLPPHHPLVEAQHDRGDGSLRRRGDRGPRCSMCAGLVDRGGDLHARCVQGYVIGRRC